ncbi:hypothetical protein CCR83_13340 [Rhodobacter veldkampii DSM 11550]|uniref:DUF7742 domain-containing protein n=1 Tax=Phaeovulum veldkampii DSM 11550 TaxID=1185920 RepID=A0A2T4JN28_9RHOB|nr:hypothetical protein [Phaeovulum veldkampii]MBK5947400.1 hypothetical protein [Phaeovulum veldkampii DSM 11550]PTE19273.1 hypothetical protein C5F46_00535 [Phaeovulum veldkampii DSM 11550]TDQ62240.1 hypothetical protein EV658_10377 [Phaeovulum veldkampii DSM 11550]
MRQITLGDVTAVARALMLVPGPARIALLDWMLDAAGAADRYRKRLGRVHPHWGNGSLMAVARRGRLMPEPWLTEPDYLDCLGLVIAALAQRGARRAFPRVPLPLSQGWPM